MNHLLWQVALAANLGGLTLTRLLTFSERWRERAWIGYGLHGFGFFVLCQDLLLVTLAVFALMVGLFLFWMNRRFGQVEMNQNRGTKLPGTERWLSRILSGLLCGLVALCPINEVRGEGSASFLEPETVALFGLLLLMMLVLTVRCMESAEGPDKGQRLSS